MAYGQTDTNGIYSVLSPFRCTYAGARIAFELNEYTVAQVTRERVAYIDLGLKNYFFLSCHRRLRHHDDDRLCRLSAI